MGIVLKQSFRNTIIIYLAFFLGGINTIVFYPRFLGSDFYGLITFLLSSSNLIMPLTAFGVQHTIIKFYSSYRTKEEKDKFLSSVIFLPIFIALPLGFFWDYAHEWIMTKVTEENQEIESYTLSIYIIAICCAYFELFYSWTKVQLTTVFGNVLKELWNRVVVMILLLSVFLGLIDKSEFIWCLTIAYILRSLVMLGYAFSVYLPKFTFTIPSNSLEIMKYSIYVILAGSAGAILFDIDKIMIPGKESMAKAAYYTVAVFMGSFIEAPSRAMSQILNPLTSKSVNENDKKEVESLYKKSSINLFLVGGLFFLLVNCNVSELFKLMPDKGYSGGEFVVLMISLAKLYGMIVGNSSAILSNSKYYRIGLPLSVFMAICVYSLNRLFYFNLELGTDGLALSTLITLATAISFRVWFVKKKFSFTPYSMKSLYLLFILISLFSIFYFWDFSLSGIYVFDYEIAPVFNILLKCILIFVIYMVLVYYLNISKEINDILKKILRL